MAEESDMWTSEAIDGQERRYPVNTRVFRCALGALPDRDFQLHSERTNSAKMKRVGNAPGIATVAHRRVRSWCTPSVMLL